MERPACVSHVLNEGIERMLDDSILDQVRARARAEFWTEVEKFSTDELQKLCEGCTTLLEACARVEKHVHEQRQAFYDFPAWEAQQLVS